MATKIMYIEWKNAHRAPGEPEVRIGRMTFSRSFRSVHYRGRTFSRCGGRLVDANFMDLDTGETFWISGCKRDGSDSQRSLRVHVDEDVREEYWRAIRG
jgi:hypothetical protein